MLCFIADYHALTTVPPPGSIREHAPDLAATLIAFGLDPERTVLYRQSDVPEICEPPGLPDRDRLSFPGRAEGPRHDPGALPPPGRLRSRRRSGPQAHRAGGVGYAEAKALLAEAIQRLIGPTQLGTRSSCPTWLLSRPSWPAA